MHPLYSLLTITIFEFAACVLDLVGPSHPYILPSYMLPNLSLTCSPTYSPTRPPHTCTSPTRPLYTPTPVPHILPHTSPTNYHTNASPIPYMLALPTKHDIGQRVSYWSPSNDSCQILSCQTSAYDNSQSTDIFRSISLYVRSISLYVRSITHLSCKFVRTNSARSFTRLVLSACADVAKFRVPEKLLTLNRVSIIFIALKYIIKIEYGFYLAAHKSTYHGSS